MKLKQIFSLYIVFNIKLIHVAMTTNEFRILSFKCQYRSSEVVKVDRLLSKFFFFFAVFE